MIAPLDIHIMHFHELIQYHIRTRTSVENVADDMQLVDAD